MPKTDHQAYLLKLTESTHDIGSILDNENVAIRVGHHCAQPTMERFNVPATAEYPLVHTIQKTISIN